jgi:7,8-dihydropterin-6-yl-methyl-4-(beta-D-ribofuranosyl)aminobenzene 5'-phosphate synthase
LVERAVQTEFCDLDASIRKNMRIVSLVAALLLCFATTAVKAAPSEAKVTILYDAFGADHSLKHGWGYSALIEYGGRRILFDTGGNLADFEFNVKKLHVDLTHLDFVVLSHRHNDHTAGLNYVLAKNPNVQIYTPVETTGFGTPLSPSTMRIISRKVEATPPDLRYFDGNPPDSFIATPPWANAHFAQIRQTTEVLPGFFLVTNQSDREGTREMNEVSLAFRTPEGLVVVVGCSHPGIEKILGTVSETIDHKIHTVFGGFHLTDMQDIEVSRLIADLHDKWGIERLAAGHCTGQFAFAQIERIYGDHFDHSGVGAVIALPAG